MPEEKSSTINKAAPEKKTSWLSRNVISMGFVSFLNDLSSDMIFPFIPIFLTSTLGASLTFVGLIEGLADATASILKIASGRISDKAQKRKPFAVFGYSLSAVAKPMLAFALLPWHVLAVRFLDRVGKGTRDAPRDALISFSVDKKLYGRAFGFHRGMDTLGAALGPLAAFLILPLIDNNLRTLFLLSFIASFFAVLIVIFFVREVHSNHIAPLELKRMGIKELGTPFFIFLGIATFFSLGKASDAFLILQAREIGIALVLLPILYFAANITFALFSTPLGMLGDRIGKRWVFTVGLAVLGATYFGFAFLKTSSAIWMLFIFYGIYQALTEGVAKAIVADLVRPEIRGTAYGFFNAFTGAALLPGSIIFGFLAERFGAPLAFSYAASIVLIAALLFTAIRIFGFIRSKNMNIFQYS
ncbi:MAG: MFS transporter [Candidatus Sungbacteria bacterium]|nr:MFS transporter [Candidatus Sungbacteria bacterium]